MNRMFGRSAAATRPVPHNNSAHQSQITSLRFFNMDTSANISHLTRATFRHAPGLVRQLWHLLLAVGEPVDVLCILGLDSLVHPVPQSQRVLPDDYRGVFLGSIRLCA